MPMASFHISILRTVPGNQEFIILSKSRLARIFNRGEDVLSSTGEYVHVETPSDWSTATGPAVRHRHFLVSLSSDLVASQVSLEDGTAFGGVLGFLSPGCTVLIGGVLVFTTCSAASDDLVLST